jgi:hypothetical protein
MVTPFECVAGFDKRARDGARKTQLLPQDLSAGLTA